ncbi:UNVERIFIED_ORG: BA14K family protein [Roseateles sp. XES5]|nr:BA14K family protein [Roseateles sp. XES5]
MRLSSKCLVVALSALFAATPVVPVSATPLPVVKVEPAGGGTDVQLVRDGDPRWYLRRQWRGPIRGEKEWYGDSAQRERWAERRWDGRRWDRRHGYRDGWYRGHRGYRYARPGYRRHDNGFWFPLAAFGAGAIIGGAIANDRSYGGGTHVSWCANRYRSYRAYDNTFQPYGGPRRQCISPYR